MSAFLVLFGTAYAGSVHVEQARIFLRQRYYAEAMVEVEAGLADPATPDALDLYTLGVDAAWELGEIDRVLTWSQQAADLALGGDTHDAWQGRHDMVAATWGWVLVRGPRSTPAAPLRLEPTAPLLDPEQKRIARVIAGRTHDPVLLPARIPLPAGSWLVNGEVVSVEPGQAASLTLSPDEVGLVGLGALQALRFDLSFGVQLLEGARVSHLVPTGVLALDVTGSIGPLLAGAGATWAPQPYVSDQGHRYFSPYAGSVNLHFGGELPVGGALAIRPAVGVEGAMLEGLELACGCGPGVTGRTTLYVPGWAVGPMLELGVEWRKAGRPAAPAIGVRLEGGLLSGEYVGGGTAEVDGAQVDWTSPRTPVTVGSIRLGAYLGL